MRDPRKAKAFKKRQEWKRKKRARNRMTLLSKRQNKRLKMSNLGTLRLIGKG
jgi:hypothetical protein